MAKTRLGAHLHGALSTYFKTPPTKEIVLALDGVVGTITAKTFKEKLPTMKEGLKGLCEKLAKDANLAAMTAYLDNVPALALDEEADEDKTGRSGSPAAKDAGDPDDDGEKKRLAALQVAKDDEDEFKKSDLYKKANDEWQRQKGSQTRDAEPPPGGANAAKPPPFEGRPNSGGAMDQKAIDALVDRAVGTASAGIIRTQREIRDAEKEVRPWVGDMSMVFDSAEKVYEQALKMLKVPLAGIHPSAYRTILQHIPMPRDPARLTIVATDAKNRASFAERFPGIKRIQLA